ncbi:MAG TPA: helix-turn-helix domain-containing protein [Arsenicitalea sp.]|nr:helix-turn-helix domain-containing protein [Arsenicitalea sp.]
MSRSSASTNAVQPAEAEVRAPKRRRGRERVASLLDAAARVFAEKGYEAATMTEIAAEARSSIGSLYQFFPTKPLLAEALHVERLATLSATLETLRMEMVGASAPTIGDAIFDQFAAFLVDHPEFATLMSRRDIPPQRRTQSRLALRGQIAGLLAEAKPPLPPKTLDVLAALALELLKVVVAAMSDPQLEERFALVVELRGMLRQRLRTLSGEAG